MKFVLDGKSLAVGLFAGAAIAAGIGAVQLEEPQVGRFQTSVGGSEGKVYAYVVDTATGKVWAEIRNDNHVSSSRGSDFRHEKLESK